MGGSSSSSSSARRAVEAPNDLISNQRIRILDVVSEGITNGFWRVSGVSGNNPLCSWYLDDTPIMNGDGSANFNISGRGFAWSYTSGTSDQTFMSGFDKVEALIPLPANPRVTFPPEGSGFPKPVVVSFNTTMYPDAEAVKITMRIPALFVVDLNSGDTNRYNVGWQVEIQLNGGEWQFIETQFIQGKNTSPFLKTLTYPLPKTNPASSFYEWKVRIRRTTRFIESQRTANDLYVDSISVISSNSYRYPMTALVGLSLSADQFAGLPSRAYDVKGVSVLVPEGYTPTQYNETTFSRQCDYDEGNRHIGLTTQSSAEMAGIVPGTIVSGPGIPPGSTIVSIQNGPGYFFTIDQDPTSTVVNGPVSFNTSTPGSITAAVYPTIWTGTFGPRVWTDNPAWIFYDLCTNKRYGLGNYIRPEWLDKWTLYQIAQYCDEMVDDGAGGTEPRFTCNIAIQQAQDAYTLLNNLVSVFRGMLYWANGRIYPVGSENRDPVFNFTNANVINGGFSYSDSPRNTRSTVCLVRWNDPNNLFRQAVERVEDPEGIGRYGVIVKDVTAFATTSRGQAIRMANWMLTVEQALTETISFSTDMEGIYLRPGDVINVYDNYRNNQQQGGRISDFSTGRNVIILDKPVVLQAGFTYTLAALVPSTTIGTGITGSDQINQLRASQIETRRVLTAGPTTGESLLVQNGFSSNLFKGSPWILSASGSSVTVFNASTQYRVLAVSEPENGIIQVVGVEYNTGINSVVNTDYSSEVSPVIPGDTTPPAPPTGLIATRVTGLLVDNTFFSYVNLTWTGSTSQNASYYRLSGQAGNGIPFLIGLPTVAQTSANYTPTATGLHTFRIAAYNANGYGSAFISTTYTEPNSNPFSPTALSGIYISDGYDPNSIAPAPLNRYTGYVGVVPTFSWNVQTDPTTELETPSAQFITGYRVRLISITGGEFNLAPPIIVAGQNNRQWTPQSSYLYTGTSIKPLRAFTLQVDTMDEFGNVTSGARLAVNNPQPSAPSLSGFKGLAAGLDYTVTPPVHEDLTQLYLWISTNSGFSPTFDNVSYVTTNFAGTAPAPSLGIFYTWFAQVDAFGFSGSRLVAGDDNTAIYGPISGNTNQVIDSTVATRAELTSTGQLFINASGYLNNKINEVSGALRSGISDVWTITCSDETTALLTGSRVVSWRCPYNCYLTKIRGNLTTTGLGLTSIDVFHSGISIFSTKLTIDSAEATSVTAAVAAVISGNNLADDAPMFLNLYTAATGSAGLKIQFYVLRNNNI